MLPSRDLGLPVNSYSFKKDLVKKIIITIKNYIICGDKLHPRIQQRSVLRGSVFMMYVPRYLPGIELLSRVHDSIFYVDIYNQLIGDFTGVIGIAAISPITVIVIAQPSDEDIIAILAIQAGCPILADLLALVALAAQDAVIPRSTPDLGVIVFCTQDEVISAGPGLAGFYDNDIG
jgi:hypothetical protein